MRHRIILATAASALAIASPAAAKDGAGYVGFDAGVLMPKDTHLDAGEQEVDFDIEHKTGFDIDIIGGYDFGFIRAEGELGWKRAVHDQYSDDEDDISADGETAVRSVMVNVLGDVGSDKWSFYAGGGVGYAWVRNRIEVDDEHETFKDSGFAWQGIAGIRYAVNEIIDIGVKYRYFDTSSLEDEDLDFDFTSHSLMFSFIYNMGGERRVAPPPPPPPYVAPPPPPAPPPTQTCPDGSVILATDACPPPPPPPPPPPEPERG